MAQLCQANVAANAMGDRVTVLAGDLLAPPPEVAAGSFDHVMANPPYLEAGRADLSPDPGRRAANAEGAATLTDWTAAALAAVKRKGWITLIHRADRLDALIAAFAGQAGGITILPLWPKDGTPAKRVIVRARKGVQSPSTMLPGLVLHENGGYTAAAEAVLRDAMPLG
jgi:tRNA1(Val) A37 N6-methylase TrmN6